MGGQRYGSFQKSPSEEMREGSADYFLEVIDLLVFCTFSLRLRISYNNNKTGFKGFQLFVSIEFLTSQFIIR